MQVDESLGARPTTGGKKPVFLTSDVPNKAADAPGDLAPSKLNGFGRGPATGGKSPRVVRKPEETPAVSAAALGKELEALEREVARMDRTSPLSQRTPPAAPKKPRPAGRDSGGTPPGTPRGEKVKAAPAASMDASKEATMPAKTASHVAQDPARVKPRKEKAVAFVDGASPVKKHAPAPPTTAGAAKVRSEKKTDAHAAAPASAKSKLAKAPGAAKVPSAAKHTAAKKDGAPRVEKAPRAEKAAQAKAVTAKAAITGHATGAPATGKRAAARVQATLEAASVVEWGADGAALGASVLQTLRAGDAATVEREIDAWLGGVLAAAGVAPVSGDPVDRVAWQVLVLTMLAALARPTSDSDLQAAARSALALWTVLLGAQGPEARGALGRALTELAGRASGVVSERLVRVHALVEARKSGGASTAAVRGAMARALAAVSETSGLGDAEMLAGLLTVPASGAPSSEGELMRLWAARCGAKSKAARGDVAEGLARCVWDGKEALETLLAGLVRGGGAACSSRTRDAQLAELLVEFAQGARAARKEGGEGRKRAADGAEAEAPTRKRKRAE